ncbi:MAG: DUF1772 domain-containing protein [Leptolyngbyaceae cyanobacterium bins.302]|nr:DUF1772 domain-containing protein [Leptolyngbyaceae cyanobacterium bins.302]
MLLIIVQTVSLTIAGLMVGNELAVSAFVHSQIAQLDDKTHVTAAQALARVYGAVMPFWYALTLILTITIAVLLRQTETSFMLAAISAVLWLVAILFTVTRLVPINNQVSHWDLENLPNNWRQFRKQWDTLHRIRVLILIVALICLTIACLTALSN